MPRVDIALPSWSSYGNGIRVNDNTGSVFDYLDPQWQWVVNAGWNKGVAQRQVRRSTSTGCT